ncbi:MAG: ChbG/HpnK family deacetylase, partial [Bacilli bacterium]
APTHIDSHHHVHSHEKVLPIVLELAERYSLPLRKIALESTPYGKVSSTSTFLYQFYGDHLSVDSFIEGLDDVRDHATVEMMCHPAYVDESLLKGSSYVHQRLKELSILTDTRARDAINERNMELISYKQLMSE